MNKQRRKSLNKLIEKLEEVKSDLESLKDEEEEYRDNMPENLQGSERYEKAEDNCSKEGVQVCQFRVPLQEARKKAEEMVFVNMNRGDIEEACRERGIKVIKNRSSMEGKLIEALTEEYIK